MTALGRTWEKSVMEAVILYTTWPDADTARAEALKAFILARHPYDLPCVVALPVGAAGSHPAYLDWIAQETASPAGTGEA